jgi:hypothetical protein
MESRYVYLGIGAVVAVGQMTAPLPLAVAVPIIAIGFWFIAWGLLGKTFQRLVGKIAPPVSRAMVFCDGILRGLSGNDEISGILNEAFNRTQLLWNRPAGTPEEIAGWRKDVNAHARWIRDTLKGKIPDAEINILVTDGGGARYSFRSNKPEAELHYLFYLDERLRKCIEKYS